MTPADGRGGASSSRAEALAELLGRAPLLDGLRPDQLAALAAAARPLRVSAQTPLCVAGRPSPGMIVIRSGKAHGATGELGPGDVLEELAALDARMAEETVWAADTVEFVVLPARGVHDAIRLDAELGVALLRAAGRRLVPPEPSDSGEQLLRYAADLSETFRIGEQRREELQQSVLGAVRALVTLSETKHAGMRGHAARAARTARALAVELGRDEESANSAALGGLLHDIGFIVVDSALLVQGRRLTAAEVAEVQAHPATGARIIEHLEFLRPVVPYVLHHHEWIDGRGYPQGLGGREIPAEGRLMAVVEAYEELDGSAGRDRGAALRQLRAQAGTRLDREAVLALCRIAEARPPADE